MADQDVTPPIMAIRYTPEELKFLRDSPLVVKPPGLPPAEQWMGPPADTTRNSTKLANERGRIHDSNNLLDQPRRPAVERHVSRTNANPEDIILGPPKTNFMSATSIRNAKPLDSDRPLRDADSKERFNFRSKAAELENERREQRTLRPKRADGEDSDGWSTVKPRKSFGTEGAERFTGRMGVNRDRDDRRFKDREERDTKDRPREFDRFARDKDADYDQDRDRDNRRNGTGRGRNEPSWFKDRDNADGPPTPRDRNNVDRTADRSRGWREKEREDRGDRGDRGGDRGERRWDRDSRDNRDNRGDHRQERDPEWMDEPAPEKNQVHTQEEFQKWKESMQKGDKAKTDEAPKVETASFFGLEKAKVETPLEIDTGPDKFFGMWGTPKEELTPVSAIESRKEGLAKPKPTGKASRFTSFFSPQEEVPRQQLEPQQPTPQQALPPSGGLADFFKMAAPQQADEANTRADKEAFQLILAKLHGHSGSTPPVNVAQQPKPPAHLVEKLQNIQIASPEPFQQYRQERQDDRPSARNSQQQQQLQQQQALQDILNQRQISNSQPSMGPERMLQDLVGQRQNTLSQASAREQQQQQQQQQQQARNTTQTEFLMGLMQSAKAAPEPQRTEQVLLRMQGPPKMSPLDRQLQQQLMDQREQEMHREAQAQAHRERSASQRQARAPPPGFYDDAAIFQRGPPQHEQQRQPNPPQPTQILQRPPPPGLELGWDRQQQLPPQHRLAQNIAPPPGLPGGQRGMPMPQGMFPPPNFMGNFPPPPNQDVMNGPPRGVGGMGMQPPPGFFNPPPGFLPPGMSGFNGEGMAFGGGGPYDGRGMPPNGGGYRRQ